MKYLHNKDIASGLMFTVIGAIGLIMMADIDFGSTARPGAGFFPVVLSILLTAIGIGLMLTGAFSETTGNLRISLRPLFLIICSVCVFALCIDRFGLVPSVFIATIIASFAQPKYGHRHRILIAAGLSLFCVILFVLALNLPIPLWSI